MTKLSPRYCEKVKIFKRVEQVAYKLELPEHSKVHPVFHDSRLKKQLGQHDNDVDTKVLVVMLEPLRVPHDP